MKTNKTFWKKLLIIGIIIFAIPILDGIVGYNLGICTTNEMGCKHGEMIYGIDAFSITIQKNFLYLLPLYIAGIILIIISSIKLLKKEDSLKKRKMAKIIKNKYNNNSTIINIYIFRYVMGKYKT